MEIDLDREMEEEAFVWSKEKNRSEKVIKHAKGYARSTQLSPMEREGVPVGTKVRRCAASLPDYIERAETGAIGRALAALGLGTQFSGDEFDERHRIVDSPVERMICLFHFP